MKKATIVTAVCVGLLVLGCDALPTDPEIEPSASSSAQHQPVAGGVTVVVTDPGERRERYPIRIIKNLAGTGEFSGDIAGPFTFVQPHFRGNLEELTMRLFVQIDGDVTWQGRSGGLWGTVHYAGPIAALEGRGVLHGTGELRGVTFVIETSGPLGGPFTYAGRALAPRNQ